MSIKKVLYCHFSSDFYGGSDKSLLELVRSLTIDNSVEPYMLLKRGDPFISRYQALGIKVFSYNFFSPPATFNFTRVFNFIFWFFPSMIYTMILILRIKPNIVHVNTSLNIQSGLAAFLLRKNLVWHIREYSDSKKFYLITSLIGHMGKRIICISSFLRDKYFNNNGKTIIVQNAVSVKATAIDNHDYSGPVNIIFPSRIESWKGQDIAIESIAILIKKYNVNKHALSLNFYGFAANNKMSYLQGLHRSIVDNQLTDVVKINDYKDNIAELISDSDILLQCSRTPEPFGRTVVEAMHLGTFTIAADNGAAPEILDDGSLGFLFSSGDPESLAEMIFAYLNLHNNDINNFLLSAQKKATTFYNLERLKFDILNVYNVAMID